MSVTKMITCQAYMAYQLPSQYWYERASALLEWLTMCKDSLFAAARSSSSDLVLVAVASFADWERASATCKVSQEAQT